MDTSTSAILTGAIVAAGKVTSTDPKNKGITARFLLGIVFYAIVLSLLSEANDKLARQFGALTLVTAAFWYLPSVIDKTGIAKAKK